MRWDEIGGMPCSVARTLSVIGDRWTMLILRDCFLGARRFDHFAASLDVSPHVLSTRLGKLVEHGILDRRAYQDHPVRHEYRLTEKGRDLYPVLGSMLQWGDRWMSGPEGPPARVRHRPCGHHPDPTFVCSTCGEPLEARDVEITPPNREERRS